MHMLGGTTEVLLPVPVSATHTHTYMAPFYTNPLPQLYQASLLSSTASHRDTVHKLAEAFALTITKTQQLLPPFTKAPYKKS